MQTDQVVSTDTIIEWCSIPAGGRAQALGFWKEVSRMWPRNWWSPRQQLKDFRLRRYAKRKIRDLERQSLSGRTRDQRREDGRIGAEALEGALGTPEKENATRTQIKSSKSLATRRLTVLSILVCLAVACSEGSRTLTEPTAVQAVKTSDATMAPLLVRFDRVSSFL